jgi:hypothetical protein
MNEHARRVCEPLLRCWGDYIDGRATLDDLSRLAAQARNALDSSVEPLPDLLWAAQLEWLDMEDPAGRDIDVSDVRRYLDPILAVLEQRP